MSSLGMTVNLAAALGSVRAPNPDGISVIFDGSNQGSQVASDRDVEQASNASSTDVPDAVPHRG